MNRNVIIGIVVVLLLVGGGFFLMSSGNKSQTPAPQTAVTSTPELSPTSEPTSGETMQQETTQSGEAMKKGEVKEFTVTGSSFKFDPPTLTVKKGDTVKITFKDSGGMHDFVIDELNVKTKQIQSGAQETVEFTADKSGTFEYYCSVGNHRAQGMKGTLTVQ